MSLLDGVLLGSQSPSVELLPRDSVGSAGAEAVELAALAGLHLDPWQAYCLEQGLSEQSDGLWAAFICAIVVPRQNGKGSVLEAREVAGLFLLNEHLILHSAHEFKTCYEHFLRIVNLIESTPDLDRRVRKIRRGVGEQAIELRNGNRLRFIARSGGSGRGMSAPCVVLDEFMFATEAMVGAIMPTLSAQPNPQLWMTSSAPLATSEPLHRLRLQAKAATADRLFYAEWGNEPDTPDNDEAVARANPALGRRIFLDFVDVEREVMSPEEFARERLGVPQQLGTEAQVIDPEVWAACRNEESSVVSHDCWALTINPEREWASLGLAGRTADGKLHVEWLEHRRGTAWIVARITGAWDKKRLPLRIHKQGPEGAFIVPLREQGVEVIEVSSAEVAQATGQFIDAANNGQLVHLGQPSLDKALRGAVLRLNSDGASVWSQRNSSVEITPLVAVTVALGGVPQELEAEPSIYVWKGGVKK